MSSLWALSLLIFAVCLLTGIALISFSQRNNLMATPYGIAVLICAAWCGITICEIYTHTLEGKLIFLQLRATILPWLPIMLLETMYRFVYGRKLLIRWMGVAIAIVPIVNAILAWSVSPLWRYDFHLHQEVGSGSVILFTNGPWMILYSIWAYAIELGVLLVLIYSWRRASPWSRRAVRILILASIPPAVMDILFLIGKSPTPGINYAPVTFAFSGLFSAWALFSHRMLALAPVARSVLMERIPDFILVIDHSNCLVDLNKAACTALDVKLESNIGRSIDEVLKDWPLLLAAIRRGNTTDQVELEIDGKRQTYEITFLPIPEDTASPLAFLITLRDITLHKEAERILQEAKEDAESSAAAKGRFLALMSHEIRTPLNGVVGFTQLLRESSLDKEQREYVELIQKSGEFLLVIINDILDYSKIEAGFLEIHSENFFLAELIDRVCRSLQPFANSKELKFEWSIDPALPAVLHADDIRIGQILTNLLGNAIKFTGEGKVSLRVETGKKKPEDAENFLPVEFIISDTGIGIGEKTLLRLFDSFVQGDSSTARRFGGTGLGLAISQRLANLMHGLITVESKTGEGSTFRVSLPMQKAIDAPQITVQRPLAPNPHRTDIAILIVEDNAINQRVMKALLGKLGYTAEVAENGLECLKLFQAKEYDLIFMDLEMPGIDGFETVKRLREIEKEMPNRRPIRIIALTAHAMAEYEQRCMNSGMNGYVAKPIHIEELRNVLDNTEH